jgi:OsmC-like protein
VLPPSTASPTKTPPQWSAEIAQAEHVVVRETSEGKFQNLVVTSRHGLIADEPAAAGGLDTGPNPYDYLSIALGACTAMTLRIYAEHKKLALGRVGGGGAPRQGRR